MFFLGHLDKIFRMLSPNHRNLFMIIIFAKVKKGKNHLYFNLPVPFCFHSCLNR